MKVYDRRKYSVEEEEAEEEREEERGTVSEAGGVG